MIRSVEQPSPRASKRREKHTITSVELCTSSELTGSRVFEGFTSHKWYGCAQRLTGNSNLVTRESICAWKLGFEVSLYFVRKEKYRERERVKDEDGICVCECTCVGVSVLGMPLKTKFLIGP